MQLGWWLRPTGLFTFQDVFRRPLLLTDDARQRTLVEELAFSCLQKRDAWPSTGVYSKMEVDKEGWQRATQLTGLSNNANSLSCRQIFTSSEALAERGCCHAAAVVVISMLTSVIFLRESAFFLIYCIPLGKSLDANCLWKHKCKHSRK